MNTKLKDYFGKNADNLLSKRLFLLDMDGTIYNENRIFDGTLEFLSQIEESGAKYVFITNNSSKSVKDYISKVNSMGIKADRSNFFTSSMAAVDVLSEEFGNALIYVEGTRSFVEELKKGGLNVTESYAPEAKAILLGFDTELTFEKLNLTSKMLCTTSAKYYCTHPDYVCPVEYGFVPDLGSMCFGFFKASGKMPVFIGKPEPTMIYTAIKRAGVTKEETVVIGDRLMTDIASGYNAGVETVCVLSGEATIDDILKAEKKPTYVFNSVKDIRLN